MKKYIATALMALFSVGMLTAVPAAASEYTYDPALLNDNSASSSDLANQPVMATPPTTVGIQGTSLRLNNPNVGEADKSETATPTTTLAGTSTLFKGSAATSKSQKANVTSGGTAGSQTDSATSTKKNQSAAKHTHTSATSLATATGIFQPIQNSDASAKQWRQAGLASTVLIAIASIFGVAQLIRIYKKYWL